MAVIPQTTVTGLVIGGLTSGRQRMRSYFWPKLDLHLFRAGSFALSKRGFGADLRLANPGVHGSHFLRCHYPRCLHCLITFCRTIRNRGATKCY
jgi:hypothetical protein